MLVADDLLALVAFCESAAHTDIATDPATMESKRVRNLFSIAGFRWGLPADFLPKADADSMLFIKD
jgi:hypothetical protein